MKRNIIPWIFTLALIIIALASCEKNNEVDLYGIPPCDTTDLTWVNGISEIFSVYCVFCHNVNLNYKGVRHDNFEEEMKVISRGDARLRTVINHGPGYKRMPFGGPKLSDCNIQKIETWLDNGAPEN